MPLLEIACFSITDAIIAFEGGADRIELCASYAEGGLTPSLATIKETFEYCDPENVVIMIRPRGGNFIYNEYETDVIREEIEICKEAGCKNIIFGILTSDGTIDREICTEFIALAAPMRCILHRAFDVTRDPFEALHDAIDCGFTRILTSGQEANAVQGIPLVKKLIEEAGNKIEILPGGGITSGNAVQFITETGATQIHASAKIFLQPNAPNAVYVFPENIIDLKNNTGINISEVNALKQILSGIA